MTRSDTQSAVGSAFEAGARAYDRARRQLLPCFDRFYGAAVACLPFPAGAAPRILDLGAGTGILSEFVFQAFPRAEILLTDVSEGMLERARARFEGTRVRASFAVLDHGADPIPAGFDAIVSALSIHHLDDAGKRALFARAHRALRPGGAFVNAEQIVAAEPGVQRAWHEAWLAEVRAAGVSEEDLAAGLARMEHDRCATLDDQLRWLAGAGFRDVRCGFQERRFAVYAGVR